MNLQQSQEAAGVCVRSIMGFAATHPMDPDSVFCLSDEPEGETVDNVNMPSFLLTDATWMLADEVTRTPDKTRLFHPGVPQVLATIAMSLANGYPPKNAVIVSLRGKVLRDVQVLSSPAPDAVRDEEER